MDYDVISIDSGAIEVGLLTEVQVKEIQTIVGKYELKG